MTQAATTAPTRPLPRFAEFVTLIAALMALTALSIDVMLPALPQMREEFGIADANRQQLVLTSYVVGFAFGQLFQGPLSDWLGRKPVLLVGLAVYALASFGCLVAASFDTLLVARFLQGLANAAPRVVAVAVVRDAFGGRRMAEVMSFVMMVFIVVPVVAPSIGGVFLLFGSWHLIFAFLGLFALAVLAWAALRLPETHPAATREPMTARLGRPRLRPGDDHAADLRLHARHRRRLRLAHGLHQLGAADLRRGLRRRRLVPGPLRLRRRDPRAGRLRQQPLRHDPRHAPGLPRRAPRLRRDRAPAPRHRPRQRPAAARALRRPAWR